MGRIKNNKVTLTTELNFSSPPTKLINRMKNHTELNICFRKGLCTTSVLSEIQLMWLLGKQSFLNLEDSGILWLEANVNFCFFLRCPFASSGVGFLWLFFSLSPARGWLWSKINFLLKFSIPLPKLPSGLSFLFRLLFVNSLTLQYRWLLVPFSFTLYSMSFPLPLLKNGFWALIGAK